MVTRLPNAARTAAADAVVDRGDAGVGPGVLQIRSGPQPANANLAATGTLLATVTLNDPAYGDAVDGVAPLDVDPALATTGSADGTAGWFRILDSAGVTVHDGSVGTSAADLILNTTTVSIGVDVTITSGSYTQPGG